MIENGKSSPMYFFFGMPSCVPATPFETSGAILDAEAVQLMLQRNDIYFLAEMMNFPGVLQGDPSVMKKIEAARRLHKPIDGHAPGLSGNVLQAYIEAGISTDHECTSLQEATEKIRKGMQVLIREGSADRHFDELIPLLDTYPDRIMFCSDDKHPDDLLQNGHIDQLVRRALKKGYRPIDVFKAATLNPVRHYRLPVGLLQPGDVADFIVVDNLSDFRVKKTYIQGNLVSEEGHPTYQRIKTTDLINHFDTTLLSSEQLGVKPAGSVLNVIEAFDGQLITKRLSVTPTISHGQVVADTARDLLKLVVYNRYRPASPSIGFVTHFGLKKGAIASTVAHDSHNLIAVGTSDELIAQAINLLIEVKGGIVALDGQHTVLLPLPIAGLMSDLEGMHIAERYQQADALAKEMGSTLSAPFMTLSFMSLACIPEIKLTDKGLFEIGTLSYLDLWEQ
jgi:adenine deaminase